jgi:NAD(P)-dependent dehydrogenase (short-subunit alcohol dehydrogenase family)
MGGSESPSIDAGVVIITGGSRGIGLGLARHMAAAGWAVAICSRSAKGLTEAADQLVRLGGRVLACPVDVSDGEAVQAFVGQVGERLGSPVALINNAAVLGPVGPVQSISFAEAEAAFRINVLGVLVCSAAVVPAMGAAGGGVIINLSGGGVGGPSMAARMSAYTASKVAVAGLTETLSMELAEQRIRVNAVAPGSVATSFTDGILSAGPTVSGRDLYDATVRDRQSPVHLDRFFELIDFLLSEQADWLTGRLLSARWDSPSSLLQARSRILTTSLLQLRRIDDELYTEC